MHQIEHKISLTPVGDANVYLMVRLGFTSQGTSLNKWCNASGLNRQTVEKALKGERVNRSALNIVRLAISAALPERASND